MHLWVVFIYPATDSDFVHIYILMVTHNAYQVTETVMKQVMKQDAFSQDNFVVDTICSWLCDWPQGTPDASREASVADTQDILERILQKADLTAPFTAEQRTINAMLLIKQADKPTCQAAWDFYIDYHNVPLKPARSLAA